MQDSGAQSWSKVIEEWKSDGLLVGLCHGVFDVLHAGHVQHFQEAKKLVDRLVVSVTTDQFVNKGAGRPIYSLQNRMLMLDSIEYIDLVVASDYETSVNSIQLVRPNIYFKGPDYEDSHQDHRLHAEMDTVRSLGGKTVFTTAVKLSSSFVIESLESRYSNSFIKWFRNCYSENSLRRLIGSFENRLKTEVRVYGDAILDCYVMCKALGKSGKVPLLVFQEKESLYVPGGVLAIAKNISTFVEKVQLRTFLSGKESEKILSEFAKLDNVELLNVKVLGTSPQFFLKTRYLEESTKQPIFVTYRSMNHTDVDEFTPSKAVELKDSEDFDSEISILMDYGHKFLDVNLINQVVSSSAFTSVNLQLNASSTFPKDFTSYKGCSAIFLNRREMSYHFGIEESDFDEFLPLIFSSTSCRYIIVTLGEDGVIVASQDGEVVRVPSMGGIVVDRVGAGDALLSLTTLACHLNLDLESIGLIANLAANINLGYLGNTNSLDKPEVTKRLKLLFNLL